MSKQSLSNDRQANSFFDERAMVAVLRIALWLTVASQAGLGQPTGGSGTSALPAFEVASVKVLTPSEAMNQRPVRTLQNGRLTMRKATIAGIIAWAFDIKTYDLVLPDWAQEKPGQPVYEIEAKAEHTVPQDQMKLMLQRLLEERFQLTAHHEMREGVHKVLRVAKGGPRLNAAAPVDPEKHTVKIKHENLRFTGKNVTIAEFVQYLNFTTIGGPVYDQTGLTGSFDFVLDYRGYMQDAPPERQLNASKEAQLDAFRELGLIVVDTKISVDILVVDHMNKTPTAN